MGSVVSVVCANCGEEVDKPLKDYHKSIRKNGKDAVFYCNRECQGMAERSKPVAKRMWLES